MVRFDKFTLKAQEAVQSAQDIAARHDHQQIEPLHLLGALVAQQDGVVPPLLARLLDRQAGTGLPPPYLPKPEEGDDT